MPVYLGIDTGGTYTDAVLFDPDRGVLASAKSLTTRHELTRGISDAVAALGEHLLGSGPVDMVALSTTLATNASVEGQGSPVCLVLIGQDADVLSRFGLGEALGSDPVVHVAGGHTYEGVQRQPLDEAAVQAAGQQYRGRVAAFAVVSAFGVLNPDHERRAAQLLRQASALPVTCSHELTSRLNAPRRAITCILNGRLIPLIDHLIDATERMLAQRGIEAPLMLVQADGSLASAASARLRPVRTILSGPAASAVGAAYLAGCTDAVVADIGGTTTDLALLEDGQPKLCADGAVVGAWRTMVEAVDVRTLGLGGDSEVGLDAEGRITIGPQRAVPLSLIGAQFPQALGVLRDQLEAKRYDNTFGRFALRLRALDVDPDHLGRHERRAWEAVGHQPVPLSELLDDHTLRLPFEALCRRGLLGVCAFTPSDAAHVLGRFTHWDRDAAVLGARLWLRRRVPEGGAADASAEDFAREVIEGVTLRAGSAIAGYLFGSDHADQAALEDASQWRLVQEALRPAQTGRLRIQLSVTSPIVAVGGPAGTFFPAVGARLGTWTQVPEHADVCNALGAVVGGVVQRVEARITSPRPGLYRVHLPDGTEDLTDLEAAALYASQEASALAHERAVEAGACGIRVRTQRSDRRGRGPNGIQLFVESSIVASASGPPCGAAPSGPGAAAA